MQRSGGGGGGRRVNGGRLENRSGLLNAKPEKALN